MAVYYKPQSPIQSGEDFIYPITTADQVILSDGSRLEKNGQISIGGGTVKTVSGVAPDSTGNVALTASDLGAATAGEVSQLKSDKLDKTATAADSSKLGGVAASDYTLKTDTAPDSSKLGGKAPEYYIQPRNLLDNSDFTNPVNQRGTSSYSGDFIYTIDRWKSGKGTPNINIQDDGVKINSGAGTYPPYIYQAIEKLRAGTYTYAARFHNNTGIAAISNKLTDAGLLNAPSSNNENGTLILSFTITEDISANDAYFRLQGGTNETSVTWEWAALYEGSYTADTLPPYVPKGYAAELAECQRYYEFVGIHKYSIGRIGEVYFDIQFTQKRISPTVTMALETASNNVTNRGEVWHANRVSTGGLLFYANDANMSYWYGSATVSADL